MTKKLLSGLCATALAASFAITAAMPLSAAPMIPQAAAPANSDIKLVQERGDDDLWVFPRDQRRWMREATRDRRDFRESRRDFREARRDWRDDGRYTRRGDRHYYNGYRGYRDYRSGYRQYNGWWFPAAAFVAGALITGAITADRGTRSAHVEWCYDRYRSYRASDNTFQPYSGSRRQCYSPYS